MRRPLLIALLVLALFCVACGGSDEPADAASAVDVDGSALSDVAETDTTVDGEVADVAVDTTTGGSISIYVSGDQTAKTYTDGLSGQTPRDYVIALSRYQIQTSADDPSPVLCFDHGDSYVETDMSGDTLVGVCPTSELPTATYTHGRVKVEWARYTVDGRLHGVSGTPLPGPFTLFRAYSQTSYEGESYAPGEGWVSFAGTRRPYAYEGFPSLAGVTVEVVDGEFEMVFPYTRPLPVDGSDPQEHWARFHWEVFEAFRWQDLELTDYAAGGWDVSTTPADTEQVSWPGVTGYHVTTSSD